MNEAIFYDPKAGLFRCADPDKLTPQQRANWSLLQGLLRMEFERGFQRGRIVQQSEDLRLDKSSALR